MARFGRPLLRVTGALALSVATLPLLAGAGLGVSPSPTDVAYPPTLPPTIPPESPSLSVRVLSPIRNNDVPYLQNAFDAHGLVEFGGLGRAAGLRTGRGVRPRRTAAG